MVIRRRKSKTRQNEKDNMTNNDLQNITQKTKDRTSRTQKPGELTMWSSNFIAESLIFRCKGVLFVSARQAALVVLHYP
jgi:hypothetical protein